MKSTFFMLLLFSASLFAQENAIRLFEGKWKMDVEEHSIYEEWIIENVNELKGTGFEVINGKTTITETFYLKKFAEYWAYVAVPSSNTPTLFTLIDSTANKFIFENREHDFPQRVIYEFHKDGKLTASIEGEINGESKRKEFNYIRVND